MLAPNPLTRNPLTASAATASITAACAHGLAPRLDLPLHAPLAACLDATLAVLPGVARSDLDPVVEALLAPLGLHDPDLACRRVRPHDGPAVSVVAVPSDVWHGPAGKAGLLSLKRAAAALGRRLVLVPEGAFARDVRLADALLVAACARVAVAPADRLRLAGTLSLTGGAMRLADAAEQMPLAADPVAAVLALVAGGVVALDLDGPLGPDSRVVARPCARRAGGRR